MRFKLIEDLTPDELAKEANARFIGEFRAVGEVEVEEVDGKRCFVVHVKRFPRNPAAPAILFTVVGSYAINGNIYLTNHIDQGASEEATELLKLIDVRVVHNEVLKAAKRQLYASGLVYMIADMDSSSLVDLSTEGIRALGVGLTQLDVYRIEQCIRNAAGIVLDYIAGEDAAGGGMYSFEYDYVLTDIGDMSLPGISSWYDFFEKYPIFTHDQIEPISSNSALYDFVSDKLYDFLGGIDEVYDFMCEDASNRGLIEMFDDDWSDQDEEEYSETDSEVADSEDGEVLESFTDPLETNNKKKKSKGGIFFLPKKGDDESLAHLNGEESSCESTDCSAE